MSNLVDKIWHLAENEDETKLTDFEFELWRTFNGFIRWQESCERVANKSNLNVSELSILHIIRMKNRPKTINELTRLLNLICSDLNINQSIQKLIKNGLVRKILKYKNNSKDFSYWLTEKGIKNTDAYTALREATLIALYKKKDKELNLEPITDILRKLSAFYGEADRIVLAYYGK